MTLQCAFAVPITAAQPALTCGWMLPLATQASHAAGSTARRHAVGCQSQPARTLWCACTAPQHSASAAVRLKQHCGRRKDVRVADLLCIPRRSPPHALWDGAQHCLHHGQVLQVLMCLHEVHRQCRASFPHATAQHSTAIDGQVQGPVSSFAGGSTGNTGHWTWTPPGAGRHLRHLEQRIAGGKLHEDAAAGPDVTGVGPAQPQYDLQPDLSLKGRGRYIRVQIGISDAQRLQLNPLTVRLSRPTAKARTSGAL